MTLEPGAQGAPSDQGPNPGAAGAPSGGAGAPPQSTGPQDGGGQPTPAPGGAPKGYVVKLTPEQLQKAVQAGEVELGPDVFTAAVKERVDTVTARARTAEKKLAELLSEKEAAERQRLEQQSEFKALYEQQLTKVSELEAKRRDDIVKAEVKLAAQRAGISDVEAALILARADEGYRELAPDDDGNVAGVDDFIKQLAERRSILVSQKPPAPAPPSGGGPANPAAPSSVQPKTLAEAGDELERRLRAGL